MTKAVAVDDGQGPEHLLEDNYDELRRLAKARIVRFAPDQTLTPTELVHEAYLRVTDGTASSFEGQRHFFFVACRAMHDILIENARRKASQKGGGGYRRIDLANAELPSPTHREDVLALGLALEKLSRINPNDASVVHLRYFGGLTVAEIAKVMSCSSATVKRRWITARTWLQREISATPAAIEPRQE